MAGRILVNKSVWSYLVQRRRMVAEVGRTFCSLWEQLTGKGQICGWEAISISYNTVWSEICFHNSRRVATYLFHDL